MFCLKEKTARLATHRKPKERDMQLILLMIIGMLFLFGNADPLFSVSQSNSEPVAITVQNPAPSKLVRVEVGSPETRLLQKVLETPASLLAYEEADLFAKTSGYISRVHVDIGDIVQKGDLLIRIEVPEMKDGLRETQARLNALRAHLDALQSQAEQAQKVIKVYEYRTENERVQLNLQKTTLNRKTELFKKDAISNQELDEIESTHNSALAQVAISEAEIERERGELQVIQADIQAEEARIPVLQARIDRLRTLMEYARIRAPFDGVITWRGVHPGDFVRSAVEGTTSPLLKIARTDRLRVVMEVPESDSHHIREGLPVAIHFPIGGQKPLKAKIARFARALDDSTRTMRAEADLRNPPENVRPGMYVKTEIELSENKTALMIPSKAVREKKGNYFAWIVEDGKVKEVPLRLGFDDGIQVEIKKGLNASDALILSAPNDLEPGTEVEPVSEKG